MVKLSHNKIYKYMKFLKKLSRLTLGFKKSKKTITPSTPINMTSNPNKTLSKIAAHRIEDLVDDFSCQ